MLNILSINSFSIICSLIYVSASNYEVDMGGGGGRKFSFSNPAESRDLSHCIRNHSIGQDELSRMAF